MQLTLKCGFEQYPDQEEVEAKIARKRKEGRHGDVLRKYLEKRKREQRWSASRTNLLPRPHGGLFRKKSVENPLVVLPKPPLGKWWKEGVEKYRKKNDKPVWNSESRRSDADIMNSLVPPTRDVESERAKEAQLEAMRALVSDLPKAKAGEGRGDRKGKGVVVISSDDEDKEDWGDDEVLSGCDSD